MTALPNVYDTNRWIVTIEEVVDADTVHVLLDQGFDDYKKMTLRLDGIDAPEKSTPEGQLVKHVIVHDNTIEERDIHDNSRALYQNTSLEHVNVLGGRVNVRQQQSDLRA
jgi:hypothetical protein